MGLTRIDTLGVASCLGGSELSCHMAPEVIKHSVFNEVLTLNRIHLDWQSILYPPPLKSSNNLPENKLSSQTLLNKTIAQFSYSQTCKERPFLVLSGDHSSAMGTWSGVLKALNEKNKNFGLIWLDAHLDAHTLHTSPSGNLHGMPLSAILGKADKLLQSVYPGQQFLPGNALALFGVRSFEPQEQQLLQMAGVTIHYHKPGINPKRQVNDFRTLVELWGQRFDFLGISLDLDVIDPQDAPAVETPEQDGLKALTLLQMLKQPIWKKKLVGFEISEFNPNNDHQRKTEQLIMDIISAVFRVQ